MSFFFFAFFFKVLFWSFFFLIFFSLFSFFSFFKFVFLFYFLLRLEFVFLSGRIFFFFFFFLTPVASRPMTPSNSDMCLMIFLSRTLEIGAIHPSPRSKLYPQEWHCKDIHSHVHAHTPVYTPKTKSKTLNSPNVTPPFSCPLPVQCGGGRRPGSLADALQDWSTSEAFSPRTVLTIFFCRCVQHILQHF